MSRPSVSVIVPVYNAEPFLRECLDSIGRQSLRDFEVVVVDDGSTDGSPALIRDFVGLEKRLQSIRHQLNRGLGAAYNSGLTVARGEFIAFVEPDDWVEPDFLQSLFDAAQETGAAVTRCGFRHIHSDGLVVESPHFADLVDKKIYRRQFADMGPMALGYIGFWAGLYRRHFLETNNIRFLELPGAGYVDTHFFWMTHALAGDLALIRKPGYNYRLNNPSSSIKCRDSRWLAMVANYDAARRELGRRGTLDEHEAILIRAAAQAYVSVCHLLAPSYKKEFCDFVSRTFEDVSDDILDRSGATPQEQEAFLKLKRNTYFGEWAKSMVYSAEPLERLRFACGTLLCDPYVLTSDEFWELNESRSRFAQRFVYPLRRLDHRVRMALLQRGIDLFPHKKKRRKSPV